MKPDRDPDSMVKLVTPVIVTRGDVTLEPILDMMWPARPNRPIVWNNARGPIDLGPLGAFAAMACIETPLVYFQDDDCLVHRWPELLDVWEEGTIVCNMAPDFQEAYKDRADKLIGHGSVFPVSLVAYTFARYFRHFPALDEIVRREPNRIFTALNPDRIRVTYVGHRDLPWASAPNRLWKQPNHGAMHTAAVTRAMHILGLEASDPAFAGAGA